MSHELVKLKRILPTINGKRTELLLQDSYYSGETKEIINGNEDEDENESESKESPGHRVTENIQHMIAGKFNNIHDLLSNPYEENKQDYISKSYSPNISRMKAQIQLLQNNKADRSTPKKTDIIHSRPMTQQSRKIHGSLGRAFFLTTQNSGFRTTYVEDSPPQQNSLLSLNGRRVRTMSPNIQNPINRPQTTPMSQFSGTKNTNLYPNIHTTNWSPTGKVQNVASPHHRTNYETFMLDNPQGKPYSRRLMDPDSYFVRKIQTKQQNNSQNTNQANSIFTRGTSRDGFMPINANRGVSGGLMVSSKSATIFKITANPYVREEGQ